MSLWDDITGAWDSATSGDWSGAAGHVGDMFSGGGTPLAAPDAGAYGAMDVAPDALGAANTGSSLGSLGDFAAGQGMTGLQTGAQNYPNIGDFNGTAPLAETAGTSAAGLNLGPIGSAGAGPYTDPSIGGAGAAGVTDAGGAGLLDKANDWAKKNSGLINPLVQAGLTLGRQTAPSAATRAGYDVAQAANANAKDIAGQKTAVGQSLINQAPFLAQNAEAASKGAGANANAALQQRLQQQGYKPGDAMYESAMQQQGLGNRMNDTTAYAAGQGQMAGQESTGAGLLSTWTPNMAGYTSMASEQNAQQGAQNKQAADTAAAAKTAFDIYSNPDKADTKPTVYS